MIPGGCEEELVSAGEVATVSTCDSHRRGQKWRTSAHGCLIGSNDAITGGSVSTLALKYGRSAGQMPRDEDGWDFLFKCDVTFFFFLFLWSNHDYLPFIFVERLKVKTGSVRVNLFIFFRF